MPKVTSHHATGGTHVCHQQQCQQRQNVIIHKRVSEPRVGRVVVFPRFPVIHRLPILAYGGFPCAESCGDLLTVECSRNFELLQTLPLTFRPCKDAPFKFQTCWNSIRIPCKLSLHETKLTNSLQTPSGVKVRVSNGFSYDATPIYIFLSDAASNVGLTISILVMKSLLLIISLEALDDAAHIRLKHFGYIIISVQLFLPSFTWPEGYSFLDLAYVSLRTFIWICSSFTPFSYPATSRQMFVSNLLSILIRLP